MINKKMESAPNKQANAELCSAYLYLSMAGFGAALKHEQKVTGLINDMVFLARDQKDNVSEIYLQWYVNEQAEEESNVSTALGQLFLIIV